MSFAEILDEPLLAELYSYWTERSRGRKVPTRADIDPVDIPQLLPHLTLTEMVPAQTARGFRIRYRLAGTEIESHFGCPLTNRYLDDLVTGPFVDFAMELHERVRTEKEPIYTEVLFGSDEAEALYAKRLMLPLSEDGQTVNLMLAGVLFFNRNPSARKTILHSHKQFSSTAVHTPRCSFS
ncbi:PAS domain-containing protein [Pelagibius marinus]|uniref:PAS domain-containing protein n=1 Tax=Pelagibius marinus TaxID=2762760 RepID=UPI00187235D6|nr:PAS domain-containing protein [Pelagibius marinus]